MGTTVLRQRVAMNETHYLRQAREAIRASNKALGRHFLQQALAINPQSEIGWLWMSTVVDDPMEQRRCLERVLEINPENAKAKKGISLIDSHIAETSQLVPLASTRALGDELQKIHALLIDGEVLHAIYGLSGVGAGFMAITDARLIFMNQARIRRNRSIVNLPYARVTAISVQDSSKWIPGSAPGLNSLSVVAGSREWSLEFRSRKEAYQAYQIVMRNLLQTAARED
jgi:hypothetical protein